MRRTVKLWRRRGNDYENTTDFFEPLPPAHGSTPSGGASANDIDTHDNTMDLQPHQQRVVTERDELNTKLAALKGFIKGSQVFASLPADEQGRLKRQATVMTDYSDILQEQINAFSA